VIQITEPENLLLTFLVKIIPCRTNRFCYESSDAVQLYQSLSQLHLNIIFNWATIVWQHKILKKTYAGVTDQKILPAGLYPGSKRPRLDYTRVYYGLGQFIPRGILWPRPNSYPLRPNYSPMMSVTISVMFGDIPKNYLIFQQVTEVSVLSGKLSKKAKLTELKS